MVLCDSVPDATGPDPGTALLRPRTLHRGGSNEDEQLWGAQHTFQKGTALRTPAGHPLLAGVRHGLLHPGGQRARLDIHPHHHQPARVQWLELSPAGHARRLHHRHHRAYGPVPRLQIPRLEGIPGHHHGLRHHRRLVPAVAAPTVADRSEAVWSLHPRVVRRRLRRPHEHADRQHGRLHETLRWLFRHVRRLLSW